MYSFLCSNFCNEEHIIQNVVIHQIPYMFIRKYFNQPLRFYFKVVNHVLSQHTFVAHYIYVKFLISKMTIIFIYLPTRKYFFGCVPTNTADYVGMLIFFRVRYFETHRHKLLAFVYCLVAMETEHGLPNIQMFKLCYMARRLYFT